VFATPVVVKHSVQFARGALHARGLAPPAHYELALLSPVGDAAAAPAKSEWRNAALAYTHISLNAVEELVLTFETARDGILRDTVRATRPAMDAVFGEMANLVETAAYSHGMRIGSACALLLLITWVLARQSWGRGRHEQQLRSDGRRHHGNRAQTREHRRRLGWLGPRRRLRARLQLRRQWRWRCHSRRLRCVGCARGWRRAGRRAGGNCATWWTAVTHPGFPQLKSLAASVKLESTSVD